MTVSEITNFAFAKNVTNNAKHSRFIDQDIVVSCSATFGTVTRYVVEITLVIKLLKEVPT